MERILAALMVVPFGLGFTVGDPDDEEGEVWFAFADPAIIESSGLVARDGLVVTVNDSGDSARVFTVDPASGETVGMTSWAEAPVDIEALAPAPDGEVWVGDIGDNLVSRDTIRVHEVPVGAEDRTVEPASYDLAYPDGAHDAEALLAHPVTGQLLVATKEFIGGLYTAPEDLDPGSVNELRNVGDVTSIITDGAFFPDGEHLVLRDYGTATFYTYPDLEEIGEVDLPEQEQGEGIAVDEDGAVYLSSEGEASEVLRLDVPDDLRAQLDGDTDSSSGGDGDDRRGDKDRDRADGGAAPDGSDSDGSGNGVVEEERPLWPWAIGGIAGAVILLVLLRSLRPR